MNVRIVPRGQPQRTVLYGGIAMILSDGVTLSLVEHERHAYTDREFDPFPHRLPPLREVAEILLDDQSGE